MEIRPGPLESDRFGVAMARLADPSDDRAELTDLLAQADREGTDVISARVNATDLATVRLLEDLGFRIMDTLVYYRRSLPVDDRGPFDPGGLVIIDGSVEQAAGCAAIAGRAFNGYFGHYHADPRLSLLAATEVYSDWITRLLTRPSDGQIALCAVRDGRPIGFIVGVRRDGTTSEIVLNAVDPSDQGSGCYGALLRHYLLNTSERLDREVIVSTQLQNYRVQRAWRREGLFLFDSHHTLHRWRP